MGHNTKKSIEQINDVSRQLLSRILVMQTDSQITSQERDLKTFDTQSNDDENKELTELTELTEKRQILITNLFEQNTADNISSELALLQEMITLDSELTTNAKLSKQLITEQVIKIKKSNKVTKSYRKY